ncbi:MAG: hypothetical protein GY801_43655 [bacterium]|nr:hypothetical protein [bacterium]
MKNKVSRQHLEFLLTILTAIVTVRIYNSSPLLISAGILGSVIALPFFLKKPEYAILAIAAILPFRDIHIASLLYVKRGLIWGGFAYILIRELMQSKRGISRNISVFTKITIFFLASLIISLVQTAAALNTTSLVTPAMLKAAVLFYAITIVDEILIVYIGCYSLKTVQHIRLLLDGMLTASACVALLGIWQYYHGGTPPLLSFLFEPDFHFYGRATSIFSNPNELGGFIAIMVVVAFVSFAWGASNHWQRFFFYLPIVLMNVWVLILSFSRGAMVQLFLGVMVVGYLYYTKIARKKLSWKTVLFVLLVLVIVALAINYYDLYMRTRLSSQRGGNFYRALYQTRVVSDSLRQNVALRAIETFIDNPFFGIGYNLFWAGRIAGFFGLSPHNQFLKILAEMGLMGFIPFIGMLAITLKTGISIWKKPAESQPDKDGQIAMFILLSGMSSAIFGFLFIDSLTMIAVSGSLWVFSGAVFALERNYSSS